MPIYTWIWIIVIGLVLLFGILPLLVLPFILYSYLAVRTTKTRWGRECAFPDDEEYVRMFNIGMEWDDRYKQFKTPVDIKSDRYHLYGEYFDFGGKAAVIIVPGRTESLLYSYYFAEPYRKLGYNVLVIDNRGHGKSDGRLVHFGLREYPDLIRWGELLHDRYHNERVVIHGICIGSCCGLYALTDAHCPAYMDALVAEGMYTTFYDSFVNHLIEMKKRIEPMTTMVMFYIRLISRVDVTRDGPIFRMNQMHKPILFIHSREDTYSLPEYADRLYALCPSDHKQLVFFDKGAHSRVRINDPETYDRTIIEFLSNNPSSTPS